MSAFLHVYIYVRVHGAHRGQKRALDPLEMKLQKAVSFQVGAGLKLSPLVSTLEPTKIRDLLFCIFCV